MTKITLSFILILATVCIGSTRIVTNDLVYRGPCMTSQIVDSLQMTKDSLQTILNDRAFERRLKAETIRLRKEIDSLRLEIKK